jgi:AcrR family transcriptional regulator
MSPGSIAALAPDPPAPLYPKLRPRPNGPPHEQIVANQRYRLCGAMIAAVAAHGYARTSVAQLCRLAGVSKRTFYEQFEDKQDCFLASVESCIARVGLPTGTAGPFTSLSLVVGV